MKVIYTRIKLLTFVLIFLLNYQTKCYSQLFGNSLNFDGTNDYVTLASNPVSGLTSITIEFWVHTNNTNTFHRVFDFGSGDNNYMYFTTLGSTNFPRFGIKSTSSSELIIPGTFELQKGKWHHVAITINATTNTGILYINGVQVNQNNSLTLNPSSLGNITLNYFGRSQYAVDPYFNGGIDEFRIWNTVRSITEIQNNMNTEISTSSTGLVRYYKFNQGNWGGNNLTVNSLMDSKVPEINGTLNNFALTGLTSNWVGSGVKLSAPGNALQFDGSSDYVDATIPFTHINNFTIETWINPTSFVGGNKGIFTYGYDNTLTSNGINLTIDASGFLYFNHAGIAGYNTGYQFPSTNRWYHVAISRGGGVSKTYINGNLIFSTSSSSPSTPTDFNIGSHTSNRFFNGKIDEFRFYSTVLTPAQIQSDMLNTTISVPASLVAYYNFDTAVANQNNSGVTTLKDLSGNNYNGTLMTFALNGSTSNWVESYALVMPTATAATNITATGFTANWSMPNAGLIDSFYLDVSAVPNFTSVISGSPFAVVGGTTNKSLTGLTAGTYYYRVSASKTSVSSQGAYSNIISTGPGNALQFDGINDYVSLPNGSINTKLTGGQVTVEAWVNSSVSGNLKTIIKNWGTSINGAFHFDIQNGILYVTVAQSNNTTITLSSPSSLEINRWYHVAFSANGTTVKLFVNGQEVGSATYNGTLKTDFQYVNIGSKPSNSGGSDGANPGYFNGSMDEIRIWNVGKSEAEIQTNMRNPIDPNTSGLIAYYNFNNGLANGTNTGLTTLNDQTLNLINGTLNNFGLTGNTSNWIESYAMVVPVATNASNITTNSFTANWTPELIGVVNNYLLDVSTSSTFATSISGSPFSVTGNSYNVTGLIAGPFYYRVRCNKTSLTDIGAYSNSITMTALPIILNNFYAEKQNTSVVLKWSTASEINNNYFEIQKSKDGTEFNVIGNVESKGNSSVTTNYSFVDVQPFSGLNYYRLKQVDKNGKSSFSEIRKIDFTTKFSSINIYPNPIKDGKLNIDLGEEISKSIDFSINDLQGRVIKKGVLNYRQQTILINELKNGNYVLKIGDNNSKLILKN